MGGNIAKAHRVTRRPPGTSASTIGHGLRLILPGRREGPTGFVRRSLGLPLAPGCIGGAVDTKIRKSPQCFCLAPPSKFTTPLLRQPEMNVTKSTSAQVEVVAAVLATYAERRVFRGFSRGPTAGGKATFRIAWHRGRVFELAFDSNSGTLRLPEVLTGVPRDSTMYQDLKTFISGRRSEQLPDHRRIDSQRASPDVQPRRKCTTGPDDEKR